MRFFSLLFGRVCVEMRERWTNEKCNFQQYFSYIVAVSFICGGNGVPGEKPPNVVSSRPRN